jgi:TonB family protein
MSRLLFAAAFLCLVQPQYASQVCVVHVESLDYPRVARAARISGVVVLRAEVGVDGKVQSVQKLEGNKLLVAEAEKNLKKWVFNAGGPAEIEVMYEFKFTAPPSYYDVPPTLVFDLPTRVRVITGPMPTIRD